MKEGEILCRPDMLVLKGIRLSSIRLMHHLVSPTALAHVVPMNSHVFFRMPYHSCPLNMRNSTYIASPAMFRRSSATRHGSGHLPASQQLLEMAKSSGLIMLKSI